MGKTFLRLALVSFSGRLRHRLLKDERGVSAVEYGIIISLIVLAMVGGLSSVGDTTSDMWNRVSTTVKGE